MARSWGGDARQGGGAPETGGVGTEGRNRRKGSRDGLLGARQGKAFSLQRPVSSSCLICVVSTRTRVGHKPGLGPREVLRELRTLSLPPNGFEMTAARSVPGLSHPSSHSLEEEWKDGGVQEGRTHPGQALTTSSMTGSGLAASSCSFTFSSTRGRKTTVSAGWEGATTAGLAVVPSGEAGLFPAGLPTSSWAPNQPVAKAPAQAMLAGCPGLPTERKGQQGAAGWS